MREEAAVHMQNFNGFPINHRRHPGEDIHEVPLELLTAAARMRARFLIQR